MKNKEIKTRQQLIERLNNIDRKCIDEGLHFHDLKTLYESQEHKLSAKDRSSISKLAAREDNADAIKAYIDAKSVEEDFDFDNYGDPIEYKGYYIEHGFYGGNEYTVQYCGDDIEFNSVEDAKQFIDEVSEQNDFYFNEGIDIESTGIRMMPLGQAAIKVKNKFNQDAKAYPYWVVKTEKWYDPEGLDIDNKNINIQFAGDYDECKDWIDRLIKKAKADKGKGSCVIEDYGDDYVKLYYPHAVAKSMFSIQENTKLEEDFDDDNYDDSYEDTDDLELVTDDMNAGYWFESLIEDVDFNDSSLNEKVYDYYINTFSDDELADEIDPDVTFKDVLDALINDNDVYGVIGVGDSIIRERVFDRLSELLNVDYDAIYDTWIEGGTSYLESLSEDINRYSDVIPKEERKFWYFTTHGVQPGSIPNDLNVLEIKDTPNGTFVALDGVLNTSELRKYDMKEKSPNDALEESVLTNDEYDYFNVYDEHGLVGEFPTYEDAKNACGEGCKINGVVQYGGDEYEETPLNEDINDKYKIFNVYISIDWELDGSYEEREEIGKFGGRDDWDNIGYDFRSFLENSDFEGVEEIDAANIYGDYENINGLLYVTFKDECTIKEAKERVYNILYEWDYKDTVWYEFNGPKRDVDDWDSWEVEFNVNINDVEILKIEPNTEE